MVAGSPGQWPVGADRRLSPPCLHIIHHARRRQGKGAVGASTLVDLEPRLSTLCRTRLGTPARTMPQTWGREVHHGLTLTHTSGVGIGMPC